MIKPNHLKEVAIVFLKLGFFAFGGPAAHIALMEEELVKKRKWLSREHFLDLIGATNLIPGPNSTEMTMHCGYERAGLPGLFLAGICFILPAALITGIFAWFYISFGKLPEIEPFFYGIKPAIIVIIINAIYRLGQKALKNWQIGIIGVLAIVASLLGLNEIYALLGAGVVAIVWFSGERLFSSKNSSSLAPFLLFVPPSITGFSNGKLFMIFLKIGATLYGSGYVLIAYLQAELIDNAGLITKTQLLDAVAIGQFTPGPLFTTATFLGYQINGISGAVFATIGIFLPSFIFVLILNPFIPKLRKSKIMGYFMDGVNIGALGVMIAVAFELVESVLIDWKTILIAGIAMIMVFGFEKLNATWTIIGCAIMGYLLKLI